MTRLARIVAALLIAWPAVAGTVVVKHKAGGGGAAWYSDPNWLRRRAIVVDASQIPDAADLTDFPMLVSFASDTTLDDPDNLNADVLFTASDGTTKLDHDLDAIDSATGTVRAWVRIPTLDDSANTTIYMYYRNTTITTASIEAPDTTWNATYIGRWSLDGTDTTPDDTSGNARHMGENGDPTENATGKIGTGVTVTRASTWLTIPWGNAINPTTQSITMCAWANRSADSGADEHVFAAGNSNNNRFYWRFRGGQTNDPVSARVGSGDTTPATGNGTTTTATWYRACLVADAGTDVFTARLNTTSIVAGATQSTSNAFGGDFLLGAPWNVTAEGLTGTVDEAWIYGGVKSAEFLDAEYNNQNNPAVGGWLASITDSSISDTFSDVLFFTSWEKDAVCGGTAPGVYTTSSSNPNRDYPNAVTCNLTTCQAGNPGIIVDTTAVMAGTYGLHVQGHGACVGGADAGEECDSGATCDSATCSSGSIWNVAECNSTATMSPDVGCAIISLKRIGTGAENFFRSQGGTGRFQCGFSGSEVQCDYFDGTNTLSVVSTGSAVPVTGVKRAIKFCWDATAGTPIAKMSIFSDSGQVGSDYTDTTGSPGAITTAADAWQYVTVGDASGQINTEVYYDTCIITSSYTRTGTQIEGLRNASESPR